MHRNVRAISPPSAIAAPARLPYWLQQGLRGAAAVLFFGAIIGGYLLYQAHKPAASSTQSQPAADYRWADAADSMRGNLQHAVDAARAGNTQGAADAMTKVAAACRQAGGYVVGSSDAEQRVRAACTAESFPVGQ